MEIYKERNMENPELYEKIVEIIPKKLEEVFYIEEKLETIGIDAKFLHRISIYPHNYYYYLINNKYIMNLYFKDEELKYIAIYIENPQKDVICEKDLES